VLFAWCLVPFVCLATANSAGYRFGASDLAFYGPAVMRHLDPELFPRDRAIIDAQARLTLMDETVGTVARATTRNFPLLLLSLYLATLTLLAAGAAAIGARLYRHGWSVVVLLAALTLRHAIAKSGANTLEAYFHPRQLAFAFGVIALAAFLRGRMAAMSLALAGAALLHPTTTLWFGIWLAVAAFVAERRWRIPLLIAAAAGALIGSWALVSGPLAGRLVTMDPQWLAAIAEKDYLFPIDWPLSAWLLNLGYVPLIWLIHRQRVRAELLVPRETAAVIGCCSLVVVFLGAVALNAADVALAIQLQPARVFWMLDFLALVYVVWALADVNPVSVRRPVIVAALALAIAALRGVYVMRVEFPDRPLFEFRVPGDWGRVAEWARATPRETGWLADPNHASRYGTSLRMAAARDVFVEGVKDAAIGMYDRRIALRTRERLRQLEDFARLSPERARRLGLEYELDYLITEQDLPLPLAFASGAIRIYRLR
jgi:hypothetical protein